MDHMNYKRHRSKYIMNRILNIREAILVVVANTIFILFISFKN